MDIMNELPPQHFTAVDDLLAFISIYDDRARTDAYLNMLRAHAGDIRNRVCVDAGSGLGLFAEEMARLGAKKVYAIERNPALYELCSTRLRTYPNVKCIQADIRDWQPPEPVSVFVHDFFGQLLYDEDLYVLKNLPYSPGIFLPDRAELWVGSTRSQQLEDGVVTRDVIAHLKGVLVSGLFDEEGLDLQQRVIEWRPGFFQNEITADVSRLEGDLLYFGLVLKDGEKVMCQAGRCSNWSFVWTPRTGNRFRLKFEPSERGSAVYFEWVA